jgi:hypothetical protein
VQKPYGKFVRDEFESRLKRLIPSACRVAKPGPRYWPDERVYRIDDEVSSRSFVVIYSPHPNGSNSFTVEIGWAPLGSLPELNHRPSQESLEDALVLPQAVFRLGKFAAPSWDFMKITPLLETEPELSNERREKIKGLLDRSLADLESKGLALFRQAGMVLPGNERSKS